MYLVNAGCITIERLDEKEKHNTKIALIFMAPGSDVAGLHIMG